MKYNEDYNEHREKNSPRECKHYQTSSRYRQTHHEKTRSTVLGPQAAFFSNPNLRSPKKSQRKLQNEEELAMADNKDARLTLLTMVHGGSLSLIGFELLRLLHWASSQCLAQSIYGKLGRKLTRSSVQFHFLYFNNIRLHHIRGKIDYRKLRKVFSTFSFFKQAKIGRSVSKRYLFVFFEIQSLILNFYSQKR